MYRKHKNDAARVNITIEVSEVVQQMAAKVRSVVGRLYVGDAVPHADFQSLHDVIAVLQHHADQARVVEYEGTLRKPRYHMIALVHAFFAAGFLKSDHDLRRCSEHMCYLTLPRESADALSGWVFFSEFQFSFRYQ